MGSGETNHDNQPIRFDGMFYLRPLGLSLVSQINVFSKSMPFRDQDQKLFQK